VSTDRPGNPLQRLPLPAFFVVVLVLWVVLQTIFDDHRVDGISIGTRVIGGLIFASVLTFGVGVRRRRLGGADASIAYLRALKTGVVPPDVDTRAWPAELDRTAAATRRSRWVIRVGALVPIGLGVWGTTEPDARVLGVLVGVLGIAAIVAGEVLTPRQLTRIEHLRSELPTEV
jgi:hypothetical protein